MATERVDCGSCQYFKKVARMKWVIIGSELKTDHGKTIQESAAKQLKGSIIGIE